MLETFLAANEVANSGTIWVLGGILVALGLGAIISGLRRR